MVEFVAEGVNTRAQVIYGNQNWSTTIQGTNVDWPTIRSWPMTYGAFFSEEDVKAAGKVIVLGANVATNLFGEGVDPTDQTIRVGSGKGVSQLFRVLGVLGSKGNSAGGQNQDDQALAPFTTVMKKLSGQVNLNTIIASTSSADDVQPADDAITELLHNRHAIAPGDPDDFTVQTLEDVIALRTQSTSTMTSLLAGIAGVSLVVGGIGIMNIMLASITERIREIGIRKAIGASFLDIFVQILVESVVIAILGGAVGLVTSLGLVDLFAYISPADNTPVITVNSCVIAFIFSVCVGILAGLIPAFKAARLDPIQALRYE
jgi:putative ABC transport system permease protein